MRYNLRILPISEDYNAIKFNPISIQLKIIFIKNMLIKTQ
jgi:hypothetical protein